MIKPFRDLSRQRQIMIALAGAGLNNRQIANLLDIETGTVKATLHAAYEQLGVRQGRAELLPVLFQGERPRNCRRLLLRPYRNEQGE